MLSNKRGQSGPKFQVQGVILHQPFFLSKNYTDGSFIRHKNFGSRLFRFVTMHAFVRQKDRQKDRAYAFAVAVAW